MSDSNGLLQNDENALNIPIDSRMFYQPSDCSFGWQDSNIAINPGTDRSLSFLDWHVGDISDPPPRDEAEINPPCATSCFPDPLSYFLENGGDIDVPSTTLSDVSATHLLRTSHEAQNLALPWASLLKPHVSAPSSAAASSMDSVDPVADAQLYLGSKAKDSGSLMPRRTPTLVDGPLTADDPEIQKHMKMVDGMPYLRDLILYIVESSWYQHGGAEHLPEGELRKAIPIRTRSESCRKSPFSAFFTAKRPYTCLLCPRTSDPPKRTLERALGHARKHFNFKVDGWNDQNTKQDQVRRKLLGSKHCDECGLTISRQNWSRHLVSSGHGIVVSETMKRK